MAEVSLENEFKNDPGVRVVSIGLATEHFVTRNEVGTYLVEKAHQDRAQALENLAVADPADVLGIRKLQNDAKIPELFLTWLDEAVANGLNAERAINIEDFGA